MTISRKYTTKLLDAVNDGLLNSSTILINALNWMSEDDVLEMIQNMDLFFLFEEDEQDGE